ncbi:predicted protein [Postia placenta Mad-698-R]|uniref:Fungal-type protein kinase domain-containing protein n=1 Tax=Postia placenta MAD-698-R-SB12 TaxID=670580 RepID=A0A1X6MIP0_9APHY|nr:hypothetical protein POSPLADRAFT_1160804 [Postia placenta MAD-698-R-SB12]EED78178.1 predicted protein [Postia placenta Mad-698-R]OSX56169.1 hypothetical protein POSPLADRAFT_1160804 [Postia placenta MAD-698-R-SB12]
MDDKFVPIPVRDMMCRHIGGKEPTAEMKAKLAMIKLNEDNFTGKGLCAYKTLCAFIRSILDLCTEGDASGCRLVARDTGNSGRSNRGDGGMKNSDISVCKDHDEARATHQPATKANEDAENTEKAQASSEVATSWRYASLVIECKSSTSRDHPFSFPRASNGRLGKTPAICDKERDGAGSNRQAEKDNFLQQTHGAVKARSQISEYALHLMQMWKVGMVEDGKLSPYHTERFKDAMETKWPIYKVTIPRENLISAAELEPKVDEACVPEDSSQSHSDIPAEDLTLLIGKPLSMSNSPTGHSTIGYVAFDIRGKRLVFMRDSWPLDSSLRKTERAVYMDLWRNGVKNIATPISGGIIKSGGKVHHTITQQYGDTVRGKDTRARIHFRLITDEVYEPLDNCKCSYELTLVLSDALLGKCFSENCVQAWTKAGILHCDISTNNIMVKRTGPKGTWQFSSAMLLQYPIKLRQVSDDLESFVHVLHWTILMWYEHSLSESPAALQEVVLEIYDKYSDSLGYDTGGDKKFSNMLLGALPFAKLSSKPLERLTIKLAGIREEHYNASSTKEQIAKLEDIKIQKGKKSPSQPPAAPVETDISVRDHGLVEHPGIEGDAESSHKEDARPLLDTSVKVRPRPEARTINKDISRLSELCQTRKEHTGRLAQSLRGTTNNAKYGGMRSPQSQVPTTSTKPKLQEHFWIWQAFREVIKYMEKNSYMQITIDKPQNHRRNKARGI